MKVESGIQHGHTMPDTVVEGESSGEYVVRGRLPRQLYQQEIGDRAMLRIMALYKSRFELS